MLSVIIPLGPDEPEWPPLMEQLRCLPSGWEVILVGCKAEQRPEQLNSLPASLQHLNWRWSTAAAGRAHQLNQGAEMAAGEYLWFIHADTLLTPANVRALGKAMGSHPHRLYYFDLHFYDKHTRLLIINEWGAWLRSRWLRVPFGDQGFCISAQQFRRLKGYPADAAYGEDHLLVWKARRQGIRLQPCDSKLATSARQYRNRGWLSLTLLYQRLWLRQALSEVSCFR